MVTTCYVFTEEAKFEVDKINSRHCDSVLEKKAVAIPVQLSPPVPDWSCRNKAWAGTYWRGGCKPCWSPRSLSRISGKPARSVGLERRDHRSLAGQSRAVSTSTRICEGKELSVSGEFTDKFANKKMIPNYGTKSSLYCQSFNEDILTCRNMYSGSTFLRSAAKAYLIL